MTDWLLLAAVGVAIFVFVTALTWLFLRHLDLRRAYRDLDRTTRRLYRERQARDDELEDLRRQVSRLGHVLWDSQRRWGWEWTSFPLVRALAGRDEPAEASRWLLEHAPGDWAYLAERSRPTDRLAIASLRLPAAALPPAEVADGKPNGSSPRRRASRSRSA